LKKKKKKTPIKANETKLRTIVIIIIFKEDFETKSTAEDLSCQVRSLNTGTS